MKNSSRGLYGFMYPLCLLVPVSSVRASPVPSVVRGSLVVKFFSLYCWLCPSAERALHADALSD